MNGAGLRARSAPDLDLPPAGLGIEREQGALVEDLDPGAAVRRVVFVDVDADDLRAPEPARVTDQQDGPVPQPAQSKGRVATMAKISCGRIASFCIGGRACFRLIPASTVAIWRSLRSSVNPRCA